MMSLSIQSEKLCPPALLYVTHITVRPQIEGRHVSIYSLLSALPLVLRCEGSIGAATGLEALG